MSFASPEHPIELLAPAGDLERGRAAVLCGADALYVGPPGFGARAAAGNSVEDIATLAEFAHLYGVRVYATVNTLLTNDELPLAVEMMHRLYEAGVDAFIVQDLGLLECDLPPLPLFASTQMHNVTPEKIRFLEQIGFSRVILARELSLPQISDVRAQTSIPLESFVHGALCVCYSGQCYLSYHMGGRSGNRGECAQPCRKSWSLEDDTGRALVKHRHLLSLKDFNATNHVGDLLDAGVTSFKIEGRLKDISYVQNVVAHYRGVLDREMAARGLRRSSFGRSTVSFTPNPQKTFNRAAGDYLLEGKTGHLAQWATPKSTGEYIGKVASVKRNCFTLDLPHDLHNGDGILLIAPGDVVFGVRVNQVVDEVVYPLSTADICIGAEVYRNSDHVFEQQLSKAKPVRKLDLQLTLRALEDASLQLQAELENGVVCSLPMPEGATAENPQSAREALVRQLGRLGATDFSLKELSVETPAIPFYPASVLNAVRRDLVEQLQRLSQAKHQRVRKPFVPTDVAYPERSVDFRGNALNDKAVAFYERHGCRVIEPAAESGLDLRGRTVMTTGYCIRRELGACLLADSASELPEKLFIVDESGHRYRLKFDCRSCSMQVCALD